MTELRERNIDFCQRNMFAVVILKLVQVPRATQYLDEIRSPIGAQETTRAITGKIKACEGANWMEAK